IVLVTHFMEEAQHLCDRVALLRSGALAALDTPAGLIESSGSATVISFVPSRHLDDGELAALPAIRSVRRTDGVRLVVTGTDETAEALMSMLALNGIAARNLRVESASLDDAYLDLTDKEL
ncbi:ABC transporter ATP-binding protein, partial [Nonomuraea sp. KM90]